MGSFAKAIKEATAQQHAERAAGIFHFNEGNSKRQRRAQTINKLFGEHLISCCEKGDLFMTFTNAAARMAKVRALYEAAEALKAQGAPAETQGKAFDDAEDEFFRKEAFAEFSDDEEREDIERAMG